MGETWFLLCLPISGWTGGPTAVGTLLRSQGVPARRSIASSAWAFGRCSSGYFNQGALIAFTCCLGSGRSAWSDVAPRVSSPGRVRCESVWFPRGERCVQARQRVQRVCGRGGCERRGALAGQGTGSARLPALAPGWWCNSCVSLPLRLLGRDLAGCAQAPVSGAPHLALLMAWRLRPERSRRLGSAEDLGVSAPLGLEQEVPWGPDIRGHPSEPGKAAPRFFPSCLMETTVTVKSSASLCPANVSQAELSRSDHLSAGFGPRWPILFSFSSLTSGQWLSSGLDILCLMYRCSTSDLAVATWEGWTLPANLFCALRAGLCIHSRCTG